MCSCNIKTLNGSSYTMDDILKDSNLLNSITDNKVVSKSCLKNEHPLSVFRYLHCAAGKRFDDLFTKYDIQIKNDKDIILLASIAEKGIDKQKFGVSFLQLAKTLPLSDKEVGDAQCLLFC